MVLSGSWRHLNELIILFNVKLMLWTEDGLSLNKIYYWPNFHYLLVCSCGCGCGCSCGCGCGCGCGCSCSCCCCPKEGPKILKIFFMKSKKVFQLGFKKKNLMKAKHIKIFLNFVSH